MNDVEAAPGGQINTGNAGATNLGIPIPPNVHQHAADMTDREEIRNPDKRVKDEHVDKRQAKGELYDKESDVDAGRHHEPSSAAAGGAGAGAGAWAGGAPAAKRMRLWEPGTEKGNEGATTGAAGSAAAAPATAPASSSSSSGAGAGAGGNAMQTE